MNDISTWIMLTAVLLMIVALIRLWRASSNMLHQPMRNFAHYRRVTYWPKTLPLMLLSFAAFIVAQYEGSPYSNALVIVTFFTVVWTVLSFSGVPKDCPDCGHVTEAFYDTPGGDIYRQYYYVCDHCRLYFKGATFGTGD